MSIRAPSLPLPEGTTRSSSTSEKLFISARRLTRRRRSTCAPRLPTRAWKRFGKRTKRVSSRAWALKRSITRAALWLKWPNKFLASIFTSFRIPRNDVKIEAKNLFGHFNHKAARVIERLSAHARLLTLFVRFPNRFQARIGSRGAHVDRLRLVKRLADINNFSEVELDRVVPSGNGKDGARIDIAHRQAVRFAQVVKLIDRNQAPCARFVDDDDRRFSGNIPF